MNFHFYSIESYHFIYALEHLTLPNNNFLDWSEIESICRRQKKISLKNKNSFRKGQKILWKKEKMLVNSILSLSYHVFKRCLFHGH